MSSRVYLKPPTNTTMRGINEDVIVMDSLGIAVKVIGWARNPTSVLIVPAGVCQALNHFPDLSQTPGLVFWFWAHASKGKGGKSSDSFVREQKKTGPKPRAPLVHG